MSHLIARHNRPRYSYRPVFFIGLLAIVAVAVWFIASASPSPAAVNTPAAPATVDPLAWAQAQLATCQATLDKGGLSSADRTYYRDCIRHARQEIAALTAATPTPTPTGSPTVSPTGTPTTSPSGSPSPSPTAPSPTATSPSPSPTATSPSPSPTATSPTPTPTSTVPVVLHGKDITEANTGYLAWVGDNGERCTDANIGIYTTRVNASGIGPVSTCSWFQAGINVDVPITLIAARVDTIIRSDGPKLTLRFVTVNGHGNGTFALGGHNVDAIRSQFIGASDGVRFEQMNLTNDWIRTVSTSTADHNDGIQAFQASTGGSIIGCNIDSRPVNLPANSGVFGTGAIFLADNSHGETAVRDNYLAGGNGTLRLHESMTYRVTGNIVAAGTWAPGTGPVSTDNAIPGAFLEWSNNMVSDGTPINP